MSVAQAIAQLVEAMMYSAYIDSPRFDDYKIRSIPEQGKVTDLERAIDEALQDQKEGGESEADFAQDLYDQETNDIADSLDTTKSEKGFGQDDIARMTRSGASAVKNPAASFEALLGRLPHTALVLLAISLTPMIVDELKKPGSLMDIRFKRLLQDEFNAFLDRQDQWNAQLGQRDLKIQSTSGFLMTASLTEMNLRQVREGGVDGNRLARIDFTDHAKELFG